VQHDGGDWRCLVARRFAVAAARNFSPDLASQNSSTRRNEIGAPQPFPRTTFVPSGLHELSVGTRGFPEAFLTRLYLF
jgi:hypothetical protein